MTGDEVDLKINQRKAGAGLTYIHMGIGFLVSLAFTPIMLRLLGQSEYGLYNLVASVVAYLGILNFGFGSAYVRYFSRYESQGDEEKIAKLNGMFLLLFSFLGLLALVAGLILAQFSDLLFGAKLQAGEGVRAHWLMVILVINLAFSFPSIVFTSHITARERFVFQGLVQLVKTLTSPFLILLALLLGYGSIGMALAVSLVNLVVELVFAGYCLGRLKMTFAFRGLDRGLMREITVFSSYIFINMVIDQVNWNVDKFIIGRIRGTAPVAIYGVAATLHTTYQQVSMAISNVFVPRVHQIVASPGEDKEELTRLFTRIGRLQFMILGFAASVLIFFGKPFLLKWAGRAYGESYYVALLLILPVTIPLIQTLGIEIQRAKNMHQFRSWAYLFMALGNLLISIPLTVRFGPVGAAAGTGLSMILGNGLIMNLYNHFKLGLDMGYFWKAIGRFIPALILPILSGILMVRFVDLNQLPLLIGMGLLYMVIFTLSFWFFGMNAYEKDLVRSPFRRRG